jgi:hypothetical protein
VDAVPADTSKEKEKSERDPKKPGPPRECDALFSSDFAPGRVNLNLVLGWFLFALLALMLTAAIFGNIATSSRSHAFLLGYAGVIVAVLVVTARSATADYLLEIDVLIRMTMVLAGATFVPYGIGFTFSGRIPGARAG